LRATDITPGAIQKYVSARLREGAANASVNRELAALRRMFRLAVDQRLLGPLSVPHIEMLKERNARKGFFERDQFEAVIGFLPDYLRAPMATAYHTGWRLKSELLTRHKRHLDLDAGWLRLDPNETKNGEGRQFPLTAELRVCLVAQVGATLAYEQRTGRKVSWLFHREGHPIRGYRNAWKAACKTAGVPERIPHDFRRTAVRNLERAGVPQSTAMAMVGHRTASIYRRYAIVDETSLRTAADRIDSSGHSSGNTSDGVSKEHGQLADSADERKKTKGRKDPMDADVSRGAEVVSPAKQKDCWSSISGNTNQKHPKSLATPVAALGSNKLIRTGNADSTRTLDRRAFDASMDYFDGKF